MKAAAAGIAILWQERLRMVTVVEQKDNFNVSPR
jgi:hypothetical protein